MVLRVSLAEGLRARFVQGVLAVGVHSSAIACGMISTKFDICIDAEYDSDSSTSLSWGCLVCGCLFQKKDRKEQREKKFKIYFGLGISSPSSSKNDPLPETATAVGQRP